MSCALVGLALLCSLALASDSVPPVAKGEWDIPTLEEHDLDFALWNECRSIELNVIVQIPEEDGKKLELKKEAVQTLFESRLRAARLFHKTDPQLHEKLKQATEVFEASGTLDVENIDSETLEIIRQMEEAVFGQRGDTTFKNGFDIALAKDIVARVIAKDTLVVNVLGVGNALTWSLDYTRWLDMGYGESKHATIWSDQSIMTHGYDKAFIMQSLSEAADEFILKYLTVNEQACEDKD